MKTPSSSLCLLTSLALLVAGSMAAATSAKASVYSEIVAPLLDARCVQCHGDDKQKGKLRLDSFESIMKGGSEAEDTNVVAGDPKKSYMIERLHYPMDDDERMPPEDEEQLTKGQIQLLEWWVQTGAKKDVAIAAAKPSKEIQGVIDAFLKNKPKRSAVAKKELSPEEKKKLDEKAKVAAAAMKKINATGATLMAISAESDTELRFSALNVAKEFGDAQLAALKPVADLILWLDLAGTKVTDKGLANVASMKNLKRLYVQNTAVTDAGLNHVGKLGNLEYLNLYNSKVTDAGVAKLGNLKNLKSIYLWETKVTPKGADGLQKKVPGLKVNIGWTEKDNAVVVAKADPPKPKAAAKPAPKKTAAAKPAAKPDPKKTAAAKPAPKKTAAAKPAPKKTVAAKPAAKPAPKPAAKPAAKKTTPAKPPAAITKAKEIADAEVALAKKKAAAAAAKKAADAAAKAAADQQKKLDALKKAAK